MPPVSAPKLPIVPAGAPFVPNCTSAVPIGVGTPATTLLLGEVIVTIQSLGTGTPAAVFCAQLSVSVCALPSESYTWICDDTGAPDGEAGRLAARLMAEVETGLNWVWVIWIGASTD